MSERALLGAHESAAGGVDRAVERAERIGCRTLQIFVKSPSRWEGPALDPELGERFRTRRRDSALGAVVAHAAYLINLAATDGETLERSRRALADELERAAELGLDGLIVHPGAHLEAGEEAGLSRIVESLEAVLAATPAESPRLLLENTAGQGTVLGHRLDHLERVRGELTAPERIGFCIDTCHAHAAGHDLAAADGVERLLDEVESRLGLHRVHCWHLNDSRHAAGSRRDRHANLGQGAIGMEAFVRLASDERLAGVPLILETPLGDDGDGHRRDLEALRAAIAGA